MWKRSKSPDTEGSEAAGVPEEDFFPETFRTFQRIFDNNCTYRVKPYEGIVSLLTELKMRGMKLGVLSNKPDRQAVHVVSEIFGEDLFDIVWGQKEGVPRKPDPSALLLMAGDLGADPSEIIYIGDSEVDIRTGQAAGVKTVLVSWGFRQPEDLRKAGAERIVDSTQEILKLQKNRRNNMSEFREEDLLVFLENQTKLFDEPVAETPEEAEAFLEDCMAVVAGSIEEVREYFEEAGADISGMTAEELEEASEVFALADGRYLIVEG